jgi:hypothetical protein
MRAARLYKKLVFSPGSILHFACLLITAAVLKRRRVT